MTHLRKMMLEELQRRNYAQTTIRSYIRIVEDFSRRYQCAPNRLGPKHIREYQSELFTKRKFAASTVTVYLAALRFFYTKTLKRAWSTTETPYPKRVFALPTILSQEEVTQLINAARPRLHRTLLMTPLCHGTATCRTGASKSHRHRQPAHDRSRSGWQGSQRSRCHAEPKTARRVTPALASVRAKTKPVAVPRQPQPSRRSADYYESGLAGVP